MHLVGFDSPGETIELRLTARDRSAYAAGALAAADWLSRTTRPAGIHPFDEVVDELLAAPAARRHRLTHPNRQGEHPMTTSLRTPAPLARPSAAP